MTSNHIVVVGAARTPLGNFHGELSSFTAPKLGAIAIKAALERACVSPEQVSETYMGCVLTAGLGQAPARQASLGAGIPESVPCTTINKVCGSGLKTVMIAYDQLQLGNGEVVVAGGMESMSNAPYLMDKARSGYRLGHGKIYDHMFLDGLEDAYEHGKLMGAFAEETARHSGFSRHQQDEFTLRSLARAQEAQKLGLFVPEIAPVVFHDRRGEVLISVDELPRIARPEKIPTLKPVFAEGGTVTAANSSSISDGAAAVVLMRQWMAEQMNCPVLARIVGHASFAAAPARFTTAPVGAISSLLKKLEWSRDSVDLFEINEAFAVVALVAIHQLELPIDRVNVRGGACALGHPIGASGARLLVTLVHALKASGGKRGVVSLCIGGGEAVALAVEV